MYIAGAIGTAQEFKIRVFTGDSTSVAYMEENTVTAETTNPAVASVEELDVPDDPMTGTQAAFKLHYKTAGSTSLKLRQKNGSLVNVYQVNVVAGDRFGLVPEFVEPATTDGI